MRRLLLLGLIAVFTTAPAGFADVQPHVLFTEGAVLQREVALPVWGTASEGERVTVSLQRDGSSTMQMSSAVTKDGKWSVKLKPEKAGGPFTLTIAGTNTVTLKNILVGDVWICSGQSNMEWPLRASFNSQEAIANSEDPLLRLCTIPKTVADTPQSTVKTDGWKECGPDTVPNFSAVGYYFGRDLRKALNVPIGLINDSWGGTVCEAWASRTTLEANAPLKYLVTNYEQALQNYAVALEKHKAAVEKAKADGKEPPKPPANPAAGPNHAAALYNGMIHPLLPYPIKGAIWYQGESNAGRAHEYRTLFPTMIRNWREVWGSEVTFLFVQLAPFMKIVNEPQESAWAELREAQLLTTKLPKAGMAVITDVGEENDIHPKKKEPVGGRLALAARALAYGERIVYSGPVYDSMKVDGDRIVLSFKHLGGGLVAPGGALSGFAIAGEDKKFVNASAKIEGNKVIVWSDQVKKPVAVRYGWANYPVVNLVNKEGLPASPFRTDDFPMVTGPKDK